MTKKTREDLITALRAAGFEVADLHTRKMDKSQIKMVEIAEREGEAIVSEHKAVPIVEDTRTSLYLLTDLLGLLKAISKFSKVVRITAGTDKPLTIEAEVVYQDYRAGNEGEKSKKLTFWLAPRIETA